MELNFFERLNHITILQSQCLIILQTCQSHSSHSHFNLLKHKYIIFKSALAFIFHLLKIETIDCEKDF